MFTFPWVGRREQSEVAWPQIRARLAAETIAERRNRAAQALGVEAQIPSTKASVVEREAFITELIEALAERVAEDPEAA